MRIDFSMAQSAETRAEAALLAARQGAGQRLADLVEAAMTRLSGPLPLEEKLSWPVKEAAARAVLADEASPAQMALLAAEAGVTGETLPDLAARILSRAADWHAAVARLAGLRRQIAAAIAAAPDPAAVAGALAGAGALLPDPAEAGFGTDPGSLTH